MRIRKFLHSPFNPRSYKRSDDFSGGHKDGCNSFNPRSYKRSDEHFHCLSSDMCTFNPRSYKRSDFSELIIRYYKYKTFNPRSYKRSDRLSDPATIRAILSIHAPTRGATNVASQAQAALHFQSTLLQEERPILSVSVSLNFYFQSTLLQEERPLQASFQ